MCDVLVIMEGMSLLKKSLDKTVVQDISLELGIDSSFIEKDLWL